MRKKQFRILFSLLLLTGFLFTLTGCKKGLVEESFPEMVSKMKSYKLVGKLESIFPTGSKECEITVYYKQPDLYRVELKNPNSNDAQIMVKNKDGVFVLVPNINKTFKVNSSWPNNSSYPYLLQSLSKDIVSDENMISNKGNDVTTLELKTNMFNNAQNITQKITFNNKTKLPSEVLVYDENKTLLMKHTIKSIDVDCDIDNKLFEVVESMETAQMVYGEVLPEFERILTYPTYFPTGTSLVDEVISGSGKNKKSIMKYGGDANFTIVEKFVNASDDLKTEYVNGDICVMGGVFAIVSTTSIFFCENGIEYTIASTDIKITEMIKMGETLRTNDNK